jgi:hypothetical protein
VVVTAATLLAFVWILSLGGCACSKIAKHPQVRFTFHATEGDGTLHSHNSAPGDTTRRSHDSALHSDNTTLNDTASDNTTLHGHDATFWRNSTTEHRRIHDRNGPTRNTAPDSHPATPHRHDSTHDRPRITHNGGDRVSAANLTISADAPFRARAGSADPVERATWRALDRNTDVERTAETNSLGGDDWMLGAEDSVVIELASRDAEISDTSVYIVRTNATGKTFVIGVWTDQNVQSPTEPPEHGV